MEFLIHSFRIKSIPAALPFFYDLTAERISSIEIALFKYLVITSSVFGSKFWSFGMVVSFTSLKCEYKLSRVASVLFLLVSLVFKIFQYCFGS